MTRARFVLAARIGLGLAYAYGAVVHVANMVGARGFDWLAAPRKWQALDVVYLVVDVLAVVGLLRRPRTGLLIVLGAALSQIVLYTVLRDWVTDVPEAFALDEDQLGYLDGLVLFHVVSVVIALVALGPALRGGAE